VNANALKAFALFSDLGDAEREDSPRCSRSATSSVGETLFVEGESDALVLVLRGSVELASRRSVEKIAVGAGGAIAARALRSGNAPDERHRRRRERPAVAAP
jgi:hypothetical protein